MPETEFEKNMNYVRMHKDELLPLHFNKFLLINEQKVIDSFDTYKAAAEKGVELYGMEGTFLVHFMTDKEPINFVAGAIF